MQLPWSGLFWQGFGGYGRPNLSDQIIKVLFLNCLQYDQFIDKERVSGIILCVIVVSMVDIHNIDKK